MKGYAITGAVVLALWAIHVAITARHGFALPDAVRESVGVSASTVFSRFWALFTSPFFHESIGHLAYNSLLFAIGLPLALRAYGAPALGAAYLASPVAGFLVDVLVILPLAYVGLDAAQAAAPMRLVGASVMAWAAIGMALAAHAGALGASAVAIAAGVVLYEVALAFFGLTQGFVWAYHLVGFGLGSAAAPLFATLRTM